MSAEIACKDLDRVCEGVCVCEGERERERARARAGSKATETVQEEALAASVFMSRRQEAKQSPPRRPPPLSSLHLLHLLVSQVYK
jgi:hypothetical protein